MINFEGPPAEENTSQTGGFSYENRPDELSVSSRVETDIMTHQLDNEQGEQLRAMLVDYAIDTLGAGEKMAIEAQIFLENKKAEFDIELAEMREELKDPLNRGRLNLFLTVSALETKDLADKVLTMLSSLPPAIHEPIFRFAAENPASLPVSLLCAFTLFFASKALRFSKKGNLAESLADTTGEVGIGTQTVVDMVGLLKEFRPNFNAREHQN